MTAFNYDEKELTMTKEYPSSLVSGESVAATKRIFDFASGLRSQGSSQCWMTSNFVGVAAQKSSKALFSADSLIDKVLKSTRVWKALNKTMLKIFLVANIQPIF